MVIGVFTVQCSFQKENQHVTPEDVPLNLRSHDISCQQVPVQVDGLRPTRIPQGVIYVEMGSVQGLLLLSINNQKRRKKTTSSVYQNALSMGVMSVQLCVQVHEHINVSTWMSVKSVKILTI